MPFTFLGKVQMLAVQKCKQAVSHVNGWASIVRTQSGKTGFDLCLSEKKKKILSMLGNVFATFYFGGKETP